MTEKLEVSKIQRRARELIIDMAASPTGCHLGGSLSTVDILIAAYLCFGHDSESEIVLSKGHSAAALYAVLHLFNKLPESPAAQYGRMNSLLTGHPNPKLTGVRFATGSLGHGVSLALGWAFAQKIKNTKGTSIAIVGDGELQEGLCWEALQIAQAKAVHNFIVIVDMNGGQNDGNVKQISELSLLQERFLAFGFKTIEVDGHDIEQLSHALKLQTENPSKPLAIIARTHKGKGVKAIEGNPNCHYAVIKPAQAEKWKRSLT